MRIFLRKCGLKLRRSGHRKHASKEQRVLLLELYKAGSSTVQIGEQLDLSASTVAKYLKAADVSLRSAGFQLGESHPGWKGGRLITNNGYVLVLVRPADFFFPMAQIKSTEAHYCLEHRYVMAKSLNRLLTEEETVHHIDNDRQNNAIGNLQLRSGQHGKGAAAHCADCGSPNIVFSPILETTS